MKTCSFLGPAVQCCCLQAFHLPTQILRCGACVFLSPKLLNLSVQANHFIAQCDAEIFSYRGPELCFLSSLCFQLPRQHPPRSACRLWCAAPLRSFSETSQQETQTNEELSFHKSSSIVCVSCACESQATFSRSCSSPGQPETPLTRQSHRCSRRRTLGAWQCLATHSWMPRCVGCASCWPGTIRRTSAPGHHG